MNEETSNIEHPTPNVELLSPERVSQFRGDVDSLRQRNQRFAQMLVEDFAALIEMAQIGMDWHTDNSLEKWFPFTAKYLAELKAENEQLRARIDQLTEYLRHGPNCPADTVRRVGMIPRPCDCGLTELVAGARHWMPGVPIPMAESDGRALTSAATGEDLSCQK
jgi:hypothetical protein